MPQMFSAPVNTGARMKVTPPRPYEQPDRERVRKQKGVEQNLSGLGKLLLACYLSAMSQTNNSHDEPSAQS